MLDETVFRQEVRNLKTLIRENPAIRARYDADGDGEIDGAEWEQAVQSLRERLEEHETDPAEATKAAFRAVATKPRAAPSLATSPTIAIRQAVEHREIVLNYETCNRYSFLDGDTGVDLGGAEEASGGVTGFLNRQFLGSGRPLNLDMTDTRAGYGFHARRPFHLLGFLMPQMLSVHDHDGMIGTVRRVWPLFLQRRYVISVVNEIGPGLTIEGVVWRPWTFPVVREGRPVATILKKWSGAMRELFTDADTFLIRFEDAELSATERRLLVAAAMAIDFDFFERSAND